MTRYQILFEIQVLHSYYKDGLCRDISLNPTPATQTLLQQYGAIWKNRANGWVLALADDVNSSDWLQDNPELSLQFELSSSDPQFFFFTESPIDQLGFFRFDLDQSKQNAVALAGTWIDHSVQTSYQAQVNLKLQSLLQMEKGAQLTMAFQARAVPWRYYFVNQSNVQWEQLHLNGDKADAFTGPTNVALPFGASGTQAELFDSAPNTFPLAEYGTISLGLSASSSANNLGHPVEIIGNLPNASPASLQMEAQKLAAFIYVYL